MLRAALPRQRRLARPPFLKRLPLVDLSRVASTRYAEDFRTGRLVFSRGGLMAAAIDDRIQAETTGGAEPARRASAIWSRGRRKSGARSPLDELRRLIRAATGVDTSAVVAEWLRPLR